LRIGLPGGAGTMLAIGGRWQSNGSPNDLGEASARKRMTGLTHSRTRTEIRDCCVFSSDFEDPVYKRQTFGRTGRTGHRKARIAGISLSGSEMSID
jgi:hypothetical protein